MAYCPLPDIELSGTTVGTGAGETIELLPHYILQDNSVFTVEVRALVNGTVNPYARVAQSFIQRYTVKRVVGVTTIVGNDTLEQFGDSRASSWVISLTAGTSPDRLKVSFNSGTSQAIVTATVDLFITPGVL